MFSQLSRRFPSWPKEGRDFPAKCHLTRLPFEYCSLRNLVTSISQELVYLKRHTCYLSSVPVSNGGVDRRWALLRWFRKASVYCSFIMAPRHPRVLKRMKLYWWSMHRVVLQGKNKKKILELNSLPWEMFKMRKSLCDLPTNCNFYRHEF